MAKRRYGPALQFSRRGSDTVSVIEALWEPQSEDLCAATAVSILLFTESLRPSGIFLKKMPPRMIFTWQHVNWNRSKRRFTPIVSFLQQFTLKWMLPQMVRPAFWNHRAYPILRAACLMDPLDAWKTQCVRALKTCLIFGGWHRPTIRRGTAGLFSVLHDWG